MIATTGVRSTARLLPRSSAALVCQPLPISTRSFASSSKLRLDSPPPSSNVDSHAKTSSVHASEIEHFSRLSSKWWDEHGEFGLLHAMNPTRIQFLREKLDEVWGYELAQRQVDARRSTPPTPSTTSTTQQARSPVENMGKVQFLSGLDVADIGCGGGLLSESLARLGARTTGVDASASNIGIATTHAARDPLLAHAHPLGGPRLTYLHTTAEDLVAQQRTFDIVCAMEVLEHVNGPAGFLRSLDALVKPGGHLFLSTIARTPLAWFLTIFMAEHALRLVTPGTHTHSQYINPHELVDFFQHDRKWYANGSHRPQRMHFEVRGTAYLPWKSTWTLAKSGTSLPGTQECNYFFWARKPLEP
ncbi:related to COQ3-enzyme of ubiquinone (coenzyme Q) biosynthesis [Sporisorium reilianum f. sp. reilianum]|uniref:Ubiquinone biosynthesis O-methyltransferase, mitochondrial n=1 Tax=Sporisorium reilianum f. sp. reilianum TaxID=72559 RepID=A0A2N8UE67_9BASI|nr:related to COQ3-enzyme of ubiquinone (coenzyme Q) biosynthesis [Sporisorium reilianum f. sp. reilianum]